MRGPCKDCSYYRTAKPPSQLLANAIASNDSAVLVALGKIQDDEKELDAQEDMLRVRLDQRGKKTWDTRPMMSSYCGIEEGAGIFHVGEIRNAGMSCTEFSTQPSPLHDCSTCAHRTVPSRLLEDLKQEQAYAAMSSGKTAAGSSGSMVEALWKEHLQGSANRGANEIRDAYQRKGILPDEPNYLDYCRHLSRDRHFVVCALQNAHGTCAFWSEASTAAATPSPKTPISLSLDVAALFSLDAVESEGLAPLRALIDDFIDFAGCVLGVTFSERQIATLRTELATTCGNPNSAAARAVTEAVESFQEVKTADLKARHAWRQRHQRAYLQQIGRAQDSLSRMLLEWHAIARQVLVPGAPPLTRAAAESWIELTAFVSIASAEADPSVTLPDLERHIARLALEFATLPQRQQSLIALAPVTLYEIRRAWPSLSDAARRAARSQVAAQVRPSMDQAADTPPPASRRAPPVLADPPRPALSPRPRKPAPITASEHESSIDRLTREIAEAQSRGDHRHAAQLQVQLQIELQVATARMEMESNIAKTYHEMQMKVIENIK